MSDNEGKFVPPQESIQPAESLEQTQADLGLTPEAEAMVMGKVQDINDYGTAFSVIAFKYPTPEVEKGLNRIKSIFKNGLIGTHDEQDGINRAGFGSMTNREGYVGALKKKLQTEVFFSIVGRTYQGDVTFDSNRYLFGPDQNSIAIIFDLGPYKEFLLKHDQKLPGKSFTPYGGSLDFDLPGNSVNADQNVKNKKGHYVSMPEFGFRLSPRVPPRLFKGVAFALQRELSTVEYEDRIKLEIQRESKMFSESRRAEPDYYQKRYIEGRLRNDTGLRFVEEKDPEKLIKRSVEIAQEMLDTDRDKEELLIPIYDIHGNMWWPKQMSYQEVKSFVAERSVLKKEEAK